MIEKINLKGPTTNCLPRLEIQILARGKMANLNSFLEIPYPPLHPRPPPPIRQGRSGNRSDPGTDIQKKLFPPTPTTSSSPPFLELFLLRLGGGGGETSFSLVPSQPPPPPPQTADKPTAKLEMAPTLDPTNMKEGDDVYFDCIIKAKPPIYKTTWRFNVR